MAVDRGSRQTRPRRGAASDAPSSSSYQLPTLDQVTHVMTARRAYDLRTYAGRLFIPAADQAAQKAAIANGVDPLSLRLYGSDVLVLFKADGTARIIPMSSIQEFAVEATPSA